MINNILFLAYEILFYLLLITSIKILLLLLLYISWGFPYTTKKLKYFADRGILWKLERVLVQQKSAQAWLTLAHCWASVSHTSGDGERWVRKMAECYTDRATTELGSSRWDIAFNAWRTVIVTDINLTLSCRTFLECILLKVQCIILSTLEDWRVLCCSS
jgi:hypothetical protein